MLEAAWPKPWLDFANNRFVSVIETTFEPLEMTAEPSGVEPVRPPEHPRAPRRS